jgi:hypothetical protein
MAYRPQDAVYQLSQDPAQLDNKLIGSDIIAVTFISLLESGRGETLYE